MSTLLTKRMQCHKTGDSRMKNASNFDLTVEKKYESKHRRYNYSPMIAAITESWTESQNWQKQNLMFNTKITEFTMIWLICCFHQKRNIYLERMILGGWSNCPVGQKSWQKKKLLSVLHALCISLIRHQRKQRTTRLHSSRLLTWHYPHHCTATAQTLLGFDAVGDKLKSLWPVHCRLLQTCNCVKKHKISTLPSNRWMTIIIIIIIDSGEKFIDSYVQEGLLVSQKIYFCYMRYIYDIF